MEEPIKKKLKEDANDVTRNLRTFQEHLLNKCLCTVPEDTFQQIFGNFVVSGNLIWYNHTLKWGRDEILMFLSSVQLMCDVAIKETRKRLICRKIVDTCNLIVRLNSNVVDCIIDFANHADQFVCYAVSRALSSLFLIAKSQVHQRWLDKLADNIGMESVQQNKMSFSLDVVKRIIEWKDVEEHVIDEMYPENVVSSFSSCNVLSLPDRSDYVQMDTMQVKCLCVKSLVQRWPSIVGRVATLVSFQCSSYQSEIITFFNLWESVISVKGNLSIVDTQPFYSHLNSFVSLLSSSVPPPIWKSILNLFNEVLCYGNTLALQDILAEEPCSLATLVVRSVKDSHLLNGVPYRKGNGSFGGGTGDGDKPLLQKVVLLVLKSVAVTVKETRCDSSSDSSLGSEVEDVDADMAVIERSIGEVLRQLDSCVKTLLPFHPETPLAQWVVQLFNDQDDALIESMICCLDVDLGLCYRDTASPELHKILDPGMTFIQFLRTVSFDFDVLLDFLVSNETCFLLYLLRILKYIYRNWEQFAITYGREVDEALSVLIRLRIAIERLVSNDLFPYNINPVLRLLSKCEQLYENNASTS